MGVFERFLSLWVALAIVAGVALGVWLPSVFEAVAAMEIAPVVCYGEPIANGVICHVVNS